MVRERERERDWDTNGAKRTEEMWEKKKTARGWGTIFRQKMNRMIKLTKIEIDIRLRFLFHGTCITDGTCY